MSGGGKKSSAPKTEAAAAAPQPSMTVEPFMPGMDQALAQQLAAGFGGAPSDFLTAFAQAYAPMQVPTNAVYTPAKAPAKTASNGTASPGLATLIGQGRGLSAAERYRGSDK